MVQASVPEKGLWSFSWRGARQQDGSQPLALLCFGVLEAKAAQNGNPSVSCWRSKPQSPKTVVLFAVLPTQILDTAARSTSQNRYFAFSSGTPHPNPQNGRPHVMKT